MEPLIMNGKLYQVDEEPVSVNPNNCETCRFSHMARGDDWCYMFRHEPETVCMQHTGRELLR